MGPQAAPSISWPDAAVRVATETRVTKRKTRWDFMAEEEDDKVTAAAAAGQELRWDEEVITEGS